MSKDIDTAWHLDKRVPVALIVTILLQSGAGLWWAATQSARTEQLERQVLSMAAQMVPNAERIVRIETKLEGIGVAIAELKTTIRDAAAKQH